MGLLPKVNPCQNHFLEALPQAELKSLLPHFELVSGKLGEVFFGHGGAVQYLYFPLDAMVSLITTVQDGRGVAVALIGAEGVVGVSTALGSRVNWLEAVIQVPGDCLKMNVDVFRAQLKRSVALLDQLHRYTRFLLAQFSQTAACNRLHRLEQRLARWLLMTHDHVKADEFHATHEFLSHMLGADRSEVTVAAGILRKAGLISYFRGEVKVLDRKGLEAVSCDCYRILFSELTLLRQKEI